MKSTMQVNRFACLFALFTSVAGAQVVECSPEQLRAMIPSPEEIEDHRISKLPVVSYPFGTRRESWGFDLVVRVNAGGTVECYDEPSRDDPEPMQRGLNGPRREIADSLGEWRYTPFVREGKAVPVVFRERLFEQELPRRRGELPEVPLDKVRISLARSMCYGLCPDYRVELFGDGRAEYVGNNYVVVQGRHTYAVDPLKVAALVERLRNSSIWWARGVYRAPVTDSATYSLRIALGNQVREIEDYVGNFVGMPVAIREFEDAIDEGAGSDGFIHFSMHALDVLQREGFRFESAEGARLLSRAVNDMDSREDAAIARLVELGAPLQVPEPDQPRGYMGIPEAPVFQAAVRYRRPKTVEAMIARGALESDGRADQAKIDSAFRAAISSGDLALVKRIWGISGETAHPSLVFEDVIDAFEESKKVRKIADVITLLARGHGRSVGDYVEIARFLADNGSDLRATAADGDTLLHAASNAEDVDFTRFLLSKGLDPSARNNHGTTPLGMTYSEEVSMMLLEAGSDPGLLESENFSYRSFVKASGWSRVIAWLDERGK